MWLWETDGRLNFKKKRIDYIIKMEVKFSLCNLLIYRFINETLSFTKRNVSPLVT